MTEAPQPTKLIRKPSHIHGYTQERLAFYHQLLDLFEGNTRAARAVADDTLSFAEARQKTPLHWLTLSGVGTQTAEIITKGLEQKPTVSVPSIMRIVYIDEGGNEHLSEAEALKANAAMQREADSDTIQEFLAEGMEGYDANLSIMVKTLFDNADQVVGILSRYIHTKG